ncbi:MAG: efflux RND transporter periplasmic adaptor subunit [Pigmentiphaga sp.]|nr:efflux RND transporter periplasmic adaptor subunit [Pigmentiphaga sp.]
MPRNLMMRRLPMVAAVSLLLAACDQAPQSNGQSAAPPIPVSVVTVKPENSPFVTELPGRLASTREAEVRARVPGIVQERVFVEGSDVKAGDVLFRIDPAPLQAAQRAAQANLKVAEARLIEARQVQRRYEPLVKAQAISQQEYDQAVSSLRQAEASVAQQQALLVEAQLNLGYATVEAPINGRIGNALVTEGALVGMGQATPMALIQQIDPIYLNLTQSTNELLQMQEAVLAGRLSTDGANAMPVELVLSNGQTYTHQGKLLFSGISVDPGTGQIMVRAEFPNPDGLLLPGMYARGRIIQGTAENVITVPAQAVQRTPEGTAYVLVVGDDNTVVNRPITAGAMMPTKWIVESGLQAGDRVLINRFQQVRPGSKVQPQEAGAAGPGSASAKPQPSQQPQANPAS